MPKRTELIWDGKYDNHGKRVAPFRAVPDSRSFQVSVVSAISRTLFPTAPVRLSINKNRECELAAVFLRTGGLPLINSTACLM